jgi:hypothetical protein
MNKKLSDLNKKVVIMEAVSDMTSEFDKDKLIVLSESVKAKTVDEFKKKVQTLKENFINKNVTDDRSNVSLTQLNEGKSVSGNVMNEDDSNVDPSIKKYLDIFSKLKA